MKVLAMMPRRIYLKVDKSIVKTEGKLTFSFLSGHLVLMLHLGALLELSWAVLGPSWGHLGLSWAYLGLILGHLGPIFGHLGGSKIVILHGESFKNGDFAWDILQKW